MLLICILPGSLVGGQGRGGCDTQKDSGRTQSEERSVGSLASPETFIHAELAATQFLSRSEQQLTSCK